ncbi:MAG TPA: hypothetical protein VGE11_26775 [Pseudonocardia sp.]
MSRHKRVAVASPQTRLAMARRSVAGAEPPHLARADLERARRVHRVQLRTALVALGLLTAVVVGLPLLLSWLPWLDDVRFYGIPVSWLAVVLLPYVALVSIAAVQLRRAERIEAADRRDDGEPL